MKNKIKSFLNIIWGYLKKPYDIFICKYPFITEFVIELIYGLHNWKLYKDVEDNKLKLYYIIPLLLCIITLVFGIIKTFQVIKSRNHIIDTYRNCRVRGHEGGQGTGKTLFMGYSASVFDKYMYKDKIYSISPIKINGSFVRILSSKHLNLQLKLEENSLTLVDEITLFYHNLDKVNQAQFESYLQAIRHFTNGYFDCTSVVLERLPKQLREKFTLFSQHLGIGFSWNSFIICPLANLLNNFFKDKFNHGLFKVGLIYFDVMEYTPIMQEQYYFDLSNTEKDTKSKQFANLFRYYVHNSSVSIEYDDRFLRGLYKIVPDDTNPQWWKSLEYDYETLEHTGFKKFIDKFNNLVEKARKKEIIKDLEEKEEEKD